jgi:hypothetical protein
LTFNLLGSIWNFVVFDREEGVGFEILGCLERLGLFFVEGF